MARRTHLLYDIRRRDFNLTQLPLYFTRISSLIIILLCVLLSLLGTCSAQTQCTGSSGCFPPIGNLATGRSINVSSTCGDGNEYCTLLSPGPCLTCLPGSTNSPSSINDNNNDTAWYSAIGPESVTTTMQIDFEAPILFQSMTIVWQSVRPRSMILERSQDFGATWQVYRYYSNSCPDSFMIPNIVVTDDSVFNTTDPICTNAQSMLFPFEGGLVSFSTSQHLPSDIVDATNYRTLTNLRVRLLDQFVELEISGQRFQYYSVSEWLILGSCLCNGHAASCTPGVGEMMATNKVYTGCMCEHNTEGSNCESCQMGYNNAPWMLGSSTAANQCQECMCNSHANDCEYSTTQSTGVCLNCSDNTAGDSCDQCLPGFYQDETLLLNDPAICSPCNCSQLGAIDSRLCDNNGQCNCKVNVGRETRDCSQCRDGYWNITESNPDGCQACDCSVDGTVLVPNGLPRCSKDTGECSCREGATGSRCDACTPGFYDITSGCRPCECNQGGSVSQICDQTSNNAQCPCIPFVELTTCRMPVDGNFSKALDDIIFEAEEAILTGHASIVIPTESTGPFTGRGFVSLASFSSVQFTFTAPESTQYELIMRYEASTPASNIGFTLVSLSPVIFDLNCDTTSNVNVSRFNFASLLPNSQRFYVIDSVCLSREVSYKMTIEDTSFALTQWLIDSLLLLPDFSATSAYYASQSAQDQRTIIEPCLPRQTPVNPILLPECEEPTFTLSTEFYGSVFACECDPVGSSSTTCYPYSGSCTCRNGVTGRLCDTCVPGTFNLSRSGCQPCNCDSTGSIDQVCDQEDGGNCMCRPGVGGRTCDQCLQGFYNFTATGCTPCQCSVYALQDSCGLDGQCTCPYGVTGLNCDQCRPGFYNVSVDGCTPCNCDLTGSLSNECDAVTGECTCVGGATGTNCSMCPDGFFRTDGTVREQCVQCSCMQRTDDCVADNETYGLGLILSNFSALCQNNPTNCDNGWTIRTVDGELAAPYGPSDANGLGYILLINHMPMLYAPENFLGDHLATYGLSFSAFLRISNTGSLNTNTTIIRIIGSEFEQALIGVFPYPTVTLNGFGVERYLEYTITFREDNWHVGSATGPTPTFEQFVRVLSNLTELSFSAQYTEDIIEFVHIVNISLQTLLPRELFMLSPDNLTMSRVPILYPFPTENCQCPEAYSGSSCGDCSPGFARSSDFPMDMCVRCDCNNQTLDCDSVTGVCINCQGNTEGDHCEQCTVGYYGDPTNSVECLPCECPLLDNSFSPTCILNETDGLSICDGCAPGYTGRNCELCMDGYFGNPLIGRCTTCECNGNVDPSLGPVCDTMTGQCMNCLNNTMGFECEICLPGYFGDPQTGQPCQRCGCDPGGTEGDCDSLFGKCTCRPGATGVLCNECIDGYWGISQGCLPCDCCINGTTDSSDVCDKDTGSCSCKPNVGSNVDNKCCNCSPGNFNFTDQGCQACNCSALAVSEECDQLTGACTCQDSAQGLKCDGCDYGYIGQVPNCERCHECFFEWDVIINDLRQRIADLQSQIRNLTQTYFNGTDEETISMEINYLLMDLWQANDSLNTISLRESSVDQIQQMIINLNATLNHYSEQVEDIENELVDARRMLDRAIAFDGTVNMTTVNELLSELLALNSTITGDHMRANKTFKLLRQDHEMIKVTWMELNSLNESAQELLVNLTVARANTDEAAMLLEDFNNRYYSLKKNLTLLAVHFDMLRRRFLTVDERVSNASVLLGNAEADFDHLVTEVGVRLNEENKTQEMAVQLNITLNSTEATARMTLERVNKLMSSIIDNITAANSTLDDIANSLMTSDKIQSNLTQIKAVAQRILGLSVNFSVQEAEALAQEINETILPDEVVDEILQNATIAKQEANQTLATAMDAWESVMEARSLVQQVRDIKNSTNITQERVVDELSIVQDIIEDTREQIAKVHGNTTAVESQLQEAEGIFTNVTNKIQFSRELGMNNTMRSTDILDQAMDVAEESQQSKNGVYQAIDDYRSIDSRIMTEQEEANSTRRIAMDLQTRAETVNEQANEVSLEELLDLLQRYSNESAQVEILKGRVRDLEHKLQSLTASFERASQRLQNCYKTP